MSQLGNTSDIHRVESPFEMIPDSERNELKKISHEMGVGNNLIFGKTQNLQ